MQAVFVFAQIDNKIEMRQMLNESRVTRVKFLEILKNITDNFNRGNLLNNRQGIAKSFLSLHSFISTTTSDKTFPKERIERLYNSLFSKYEGGKVVEKPMRTYDDWCDRVNKLVDRSVVEGEMKEFDNDINEGDDVQFDFDYFSKELIRDLIIGGASTGFLMTGNVPMAVASIAVPALIHGVNNELDKRGKSIDRNFFKKIFNKFRDTFEKLTNDMQKFVDTTDYSEEQLEEIEISAHAIYTWWKNNSTNVTKDWDKYSDKKVVEFMEMYNNFIENVNYDISYSNKTSVSSMSVIYILDKLEESIKGDTSDNKKLVEVFITISIMMTLIYEADSNMKYLDEKVSQLYDAIFSDYNEYGKKIKRAPMSYESLKSFIIKKNDDINKNVAIAKDNVKESAEIDEAFDGVKNLFSKATSKMKGVVSYAANTIFFEIALYGKMLLTGAMTLKSALTILARRFAYYATEEACAQVMEKCLKNVAIDSVKENIISIIEEIKQEIKNNKEEIDAALANNLEGLSKAFDGIKINMPKANEKFSIMTYAQFLNESKSWKKK